MSAMVDSDSLERYGSMKIRRAEGHLLPFMSRFITVVGLGLSTLVAVGTAADKVETEVITFSARGFQPQKITRKPGAFFLSLHNTSRLPSLEFSLVDADSHATALASNTVKLGMALGTTFRNTISLQPGTYTLKIKELPSQTMTIIVSASGN